MNPPLGVCRATRWASRFPLLVAAGLSVLVSGCSSFTREWNEAARQPYSKKDPVGRWQGMWLSDANGHTEQLRCLIRKVSETTYSAHFQAKYRKLIRFTFSYTVPLSVEPQEDRYDFHGRADLGWVAGGLYSYRGYTDATNFFATYRCKYDHGSFHMTRQTPDQ